MSWQAKRVGGDIPQVTASHLNCLHFLCRSHARLSTLSAVVQGLGPAFFGLIAWKMMGRTEHAHCVEQTFGLERLRDIHNCPCVTPGLEVFR